MAERGGLDSGAPLAAASLCMAPGSKGPETTAGLDEDSVFDATSTPAFTAAAAAVGVPKLILLDPVIPPFGPSSQEANSGVNRAVPGSSDDVATLALGPASPYNSAAGPDTPTGLGVNALGDSDGPSLPAPAIEAETSAWSPTLEAIWSHMPASQPHLHLRKTILLLLCLRA